VPFVQESVFLHHPALGEGPDWSAFHRGATTDRGRIRFLVYGAIMPHSDRRKSHRAEYTGDT
jgi:hypothetical protein